MSHPILDYSADNNLELGFWLDCTDSSFRTDIGNTFTLLNRTGNTAYDFLQNQPDFHPIKNFSSISFLDSQHLVPRNNDIFNGLNEYSIIFIFQNISSAQLTFLNLSKNEGGLPDYLEYKYNNGELQQQHSILNVENNLNVVVSNAEDAIIFAIRHDVFVGKTSCISNLDEIALRANKDYGYILNNFPTKFILGNNVELNSPFRNSLKHVLFFKKYISKDNINYITNIIAPIVEEVPPDPRDDSTNLIAFLPLSINTQLAYSSKPKTSTPINAFLSTLMEYFVTVELDLSYSWNSVNEQRWDTITESQFNNIL